MLHMVTKRWDLFLCHATEDKSVLVEPLTLELESYGLRVWYDKFQVKLGDIVMARFVLGKSQRGPWAYG